MTGDERGPREARATTDDQDVRCEGGLRHSLEEDRVPPLDDRVSQLRAADASDDDGDHDPKCNDSCRDSVDRLPVSRLANEHDNDRSRDDTDPQNVARERLARHTARLVPMRPHGEDEVQEEEHLPEHKPADAHTFPGCEHSVDLTASKNDGEEDLDPEKEVRRKTLGRHAELLLRG